MAKRRMAIVAILICLCAFLVPFYANAASTTDATEPIDVNKECSLTLSFAYGETAFENVSVKLYKVADVSSDFQYTLTSDFSASELIINGIKTDGEWNTVLSTLEARIIADNIVAKSSEMTNANGLVSFEGLKTGLYLVLAEQATQGELTYLFKPALIALPGLNNDGKWEYDISVAAKSELIPPSADEIEFKVVKLWKGDDKKSSRPKSVEVEIFRDGISYKTVVLSQDNNWSYVWQSEDNGVVWTVIEKNIPSGYTMTVENKETSFIITNTHTDPSLPDSPQTGDTSNVMLYIVLMFISGSTLIILGITGKRKSNEKSK